MFGGTAAKTTLAKRGPKESAEGAEEPPSKRVRFKAENGTADLDSEVRKSYEKGAVAKVRRLALH